jgi:hypothetical protein
MKQSPSWEANNHSTSQQIPHNLWNPKVHYCVHKSPSLVPFISQMHPVHTFPLYLPKTHSNVIFPSTPRSCAWSHSFKFPINIFMHFSFLSCVLHARLFYLPWLDQPSNIWWSVQVMKCLITLSSPASRYSCILGLNILFSILFSNILNLCLSLRMSNQVSHPWYI